MEHQASTCAHTCGADVLLLSVCRLVSENVCCGRNGRISSGILKVRREKTPEEIICEPIKLRKPLRSAASLLLLCSGLRPHMAMEPQRQQGCA